MKDSDSNDNEKDGLELRVRLGLNMTHKETVRAVCHKIGPKILVLAYGLNIPKVVSVRTTLKVSKLLQKEFFQLQNGEILMGINRRNNNFLRIYKINKILTNGMY